LPGNPYIQSAAFSPDGETLYVLINDQAINLWAILVYFWPEIGGGLVALAAILFLLALRRILRTPRLPAQPHCRPCNYCLKSAPSQVCPECGKPIKRTIRGRTTRRRVLVFVIPLGVVALAYSLPWAFWLPRPGWFSRSVNWWSYDIEAAAAK